MEEGIFCILSLQEKIRHRAVLSVGSFQAVQFSGLYKSEEMLFVTAAEKMEKKWKKMKNKEVLRSSVRDLVEFLFKSGDIDNRHMGFAEKDAMNAGSKMHRKIQKRMGPDYQAEVPLKRTVSFDRFDLELEGRADGIITKWAPNGSVMETAIDEIKCVYKDLEHLNEPFLVHLAQAKCYACIYGTEKELESIQVQMTYCNLDTEEIKQFVSSYTRKELQEWFDRLLKDYEKWGNFQLEWRRVRDSSIKELEFPFPYREGQRNLVLSVYKSILRKKRLFIQAPTGVGKTISTVFPAVKAIGEGLGEKVFYLTAKTITRKVAEEAFQILLEKGLKFKTVTLTAKEKLCFCEVTECNPDACPYAKGHFDRVNDAVYEMLVKEMDYRREKLEEYARKYNLCPFEFSLDVSLWTDAVICDYNYVFDPNAALRRFFAQNGKREYLFLIDEAHNLVERGREMFSAQLYKEEFLEAKKKVKNYSRTLERALERCNRSLLEYKKECRDYQVLEQINSFSIQLLNMAGELEKFFENPAHEQIKTEILEFYFHVRHFLNMFEKLSEDYVIYTEHTEDGGFKLKLFCINPSKNLRECLDKGNSTVFFSATLLPVLYYKELLSGDREDYAVYADSPFQPEKRLLLVAKDTTTKFSRRNAAEYQKIAEYLYQMQKEKTGNYIAFFPSYAVLKEVYASFLSQYGKEKITCFLQQQNMKEEEREQFLNAFSEQNHETKSVIGFCVLGGIFSEGIDLKNNQLIGAAVVGTGLPGICKEREILKSYYDEKSGNGFEYSYRYPGMNKVQQAAGRVIRTAEDTGVVLLLDERFLSQEYQALFPREWSLQKRCTVHSIGQILEEFWSCFGREE